MKLLLCFSKSRFVFDQLGFFLFLGTFHDIYQVFLIEFVLPSQNLDLPNPVLHSCQHNDSYLFVQYILRAFNEYISCLRTIFFAVVKRYLFH